MGIFSFLKTSDKNKKDDTLIVKEVTSLTNEAKSISFETPSDFKFDAGQFIELSVEIDGKLERRSYSICSGPDDSIAIGVKAVPGGKVSNWLMENAKPGIGIHISKPSGNFTLKTGAKHIVAIAAGSGITPIMSLAKALEKKRGNVTLIYGNKTESSIMFKDELIALSNVKSYHYLSQEEKAGYSTGRINKESLTALIKDNLEILKADDFYLCGPEELIIEAKETLDFFGVAASKIHFELFRPATLLKTEEKSSLKTFDGETDVRVILEGENFQFKLTAQGKTILEAAEEAGADVPYSCKGGVCASCKAKVVKGTAKMDVNYTLTDKEVEDGYILTCQAHPNSPELIVSFDA
jgi:ring-1,2-phenylacetyl-CoA epoxidase subunit PaaE